MFEQNLGTHLSLDETALSHGDLYTVLTNKSAKGRKGAQVAMIKGTKSETIRSVLEKIHLRKRSKVVEVPLDMAASMENIARFSVPNARLVTDRFHVQKLAYDALQVMRIKYRWKAIDQENKEIDMARETSQKYIPEVLDNSDTLKQLLARSHYLLFKAESKWTSSQHIQAQILFNRYPCLEQAYKLVMQLGTFITV